MKINYKNARCNICDHLSHGDLDDDEDDVNLTAFYRDPHQPGYLCGECYGSFRDIQTEWGMEEDINLDELAQREIEGRD